VLRAHEDGDNNYWYPYSQRDKIRAVYRSCTPVCATQVRQLPRIPRATKPVRS